MGLLDMFMTFNNSKENKEDENWFLTDEEKNEINSGNYQNYNFEEENTEEDDYYHEDVD